MLPARERLLATLPVTLFRLAFVADRPMRLPPPPILPVMRREWRENMDEASPQISDLRL